MQVLIALGVKCHTFFFPRTPGQSVVWSSGAEELKHVIATCCAILIVVPVETRPWKQQVLPLVGFHPGRNLAEPELGSHGQRSQDEDEHTLRTIAPGHAGLWA